MCVSSLTMQLEQFFGCRLNPEAEAMDLCRAGANGMASTAMSVPVSGAHNRSVFRQSMYVSHYYPPCRLFSVNAHAHAESGQRKSMENTVWGHMPGFWDTNRDMSEPIALQHSRD